MISELGRRLAADLEAPARARVGRSVEPPRDEAPDFALSLSSESLRIAEQRAPSPAVASPAAIEATRATEPTPRTERDEPEGPPGPTSPVSPTSPTGPVASGTVRRVIEAYREIARAPSGERVRIVV